MGCDIHFFVERKVNGVWELVGDRDTFYSDRNYVLFSILADVRNGSGEYMRIPISEPKGFPDDMSQTIKSYDEQWSGDWHSKSYLTIKEILLYDWTQSISNERGLTSLQKYFRYLDSKRWSKFPKVEEQYSAFDVRIYEEEAVQKYSLPKEQQAVLNLDKIGVEYVDKYTYAESSGDFWLHTIPIMLSLVVDNDLDSVRAVFAFDN